MSLCEFFHCLIFTQTVVPEEMLGKILQYFFAFATGDVKTLFSYLEHLLY